MRLAVLGLVAAGGAGAAEVAGPAAATMPAAAAPSPRFTMSEETTYFVRPVRRDGTVDYVGAMNDRIGKGIAAADNAAIPLLDAIRAGRGNQKAHYARVRAVLGVPGGNAAADLGGDDAPLVAPVDERTTAGPWTEKEFPDAAKWLRSVGKQLDLAVEASRRSGYYLPLVRERPDDFLVAVLLPHLGEVRQVVLGLRARAMLRLGGDDADGFARDAVAVVRLGRLMTNSATMIEKLVAIGLEGAGLEAIRTAAAGGWLSERQANAILAELRAAPAGRPMSEAFAFGERGFLLELLQHGAVHGAGEADKALKLMMPMAGANVADRMAVPAVGGALKDWDAAMRTVNAWYDRLEAIGQRATFAEREAAAAAVTAEAAALKRKVDGWKGALVPLEERGLALTLPSVSQGYRRETRLAAERAVTELALALSAYRSQKEVYPPSLKALLGAGQKEPEDPFTGKPLAYRSTGSGYVLRSVGADGAEDVGARGDDVVVRAAE
jgi:hypothetical protein